MTALVRSLAAVALAVALAAQPAPIAAQPEAVTPAVCTGEPRSDDEVAGLVAGPPEPLPDAATPAAGDQEEGLGARFEGEPADPETAAGVENALAAYPGCLNASDRPRLLAHLTDRFVAEVVDAWGAALASTGATPVAGADAPPLLVAASFEGWDAPSLSIASVRARDVLLLPDGRAVASVAWRFSGDGDDADLDRQVELVVLEPAGDCWLVDYASGGWLVEGEIIFVPPPPAGSVDEMPKARGGYGEVDSAAYAEPTMAGFEFAIAATLMAASDATSEGIDCGFIVIERGARSVTGSALCRADEALAGLPSYLMVEVYDSRRAGDGPPLRCEDAALLDGYVTYACTVELPNPAP